MKRLFKVRRRKDSTSEEQHTFRGIIGTLIVIGLIGWAFHRYFPVLLAQLPEEQKVAVKTVKTVPVVKAGTARGPR